MDENAPVEASVEPPIATEEAPVEAPVEAPIEAPGKASAKNIPEEKGSKVDIVDSAGDAEEQSGDETGEDQERQRKLKKREQRRMQQEKLDKHFREKEEIHITDTGEEEREDEHQEEPEPVVLLPRKTLEALQSFVLDEEEFRTGVSSDSEDTEYMKDEPGSSFKDDFMENFYFPSISDVSTPSSDDIFRVVSTEDKDSKKVVTKSSSTPSISVVDEQSKIEDEHMGESDDDDDDDSTTSTLLSWPCALDNFTTEVKIEKKEDTGAELFFEMNMEQVVKKESTSGLEAAKLAMEIAEIVNVFLMNTIDEAVNAALYMGPGKAFAAKVNLMKLYYLLYDAVDAYITVKQFNKDVCSKMFDYYRRVGQMRVFDQLSPKLTCLEHDRYKEALYKLDYLKERAILTKINGAKLLSSVKLDLEHVYTISQASDESLEECVRKTILRKDADRLPRMVEAELRRMRALRNEISDTRLWLTTRQHTLGRILEVHG